METGSSGNIFTHFFAWVGTFFALSGLTTQDVIYIIFSAAGLLISLLSFIRGCRDARLRREEDKKRTRLIRHYLNGNVGKPRLKKAVMAAEVADMPQKEDE